MRVCLPGGGVVALGGATEATIWSNFHIVEDVDPGWRSIPYGRPIQNARYYILDKSLQPVPPGVPGRSEEHTSELQSLMRISYAVFCLKKKKQTHQRQTINLELITQFNNHSYTRHNN